MACGCGCAALDVGAKALIGSCGGAMGEASPATYGGAIYPSDVDDFVRRLDPQMKATHASVGSCASLDPGERAAWKDFFDGWIVFAKDASCFFGCGGKYSELQEYEKRLEAWQEILRAKCKLAGPGVTSAVDTSALKWVAAAVIVGALVYAGGPAIRALAR